MLGDTVTFFVEGNSYDELRQKAEEFLFELGGPIWDYRLDITTGRFFNLPEKWSVQEEKFRFGANVTAVGG